MSKKMLALPVIIVLAAVISFSGMLLAQDIEKLNADYERLVAELAAIDKQMRELKAGQQEEYEKLEALYKEKLAELERVRMILEGEEETKQKRNEVTQMHIDAKTAYNIKRWSDALNGFQKVIDEGEALNTPLLNEVIRYSYVYIAQIYYQQKKYDAMIKPLEQAIAIDSSFYSAYNLMGKSYELQGNYDSAISIYTKSIEINDTEVNWKAHHNMGIVYLKMMEYVKAREKFLHAVERDPQQYIAFHYLGRSYFELKEYGNAQLALERSVQLNKIYYEHYYYLAQVYNKTGDYKEAIEAANNSMKYDTRKITFGGALIERGIAREYLDENALALEDYQAAAKYPDWKQMAEHRIEILTKFGGIKALIDTSSVSIHNKTLIDAKIYLKRYKK